MTQFLQTMNRRTSLKRFGALAGALAFRAVGGEARATGSGLPHVPTEAEAQAMENHVHPFMKQFKVPGLSVAIALSGHTVYRNGFGFADRTTHEKVTPASMFRIASVTKPITSVAIHTLVEQGKLRLTDHVFGPTGILKARYGHIHRPHLDKITVHHLLTHTGGGWQNDGNDPMFLHPEMNHEQLITWTLENQPLTNAPGLHYAYSNFGYCVLGRVIEHVSGQPYTTYVERAVFTPCGMTAQGSPRLAGNTLQERGKGEVVYYTNASEGDPYGMNVRRMDSHGGWVATAAQLVRFATHVDGMFTTTPSLLRPETIREMTTATTANASYASGWSVNTTPNWWHNGSLPGTNSILVRTASGLCWAALVNTRTAGIDVALDQLIWKMAQEVPAWHA